MKSNFSDKARRDYHLIEEAKNGNKKAYADLLGYYRDSLYFLLLKMVNNKEDAEDLTIESFEKAFRNIDTYTPTFAFSTWLFKIATNHGIDFLRSQKSQKKHVSFDDSGNTTESSYMKSYSIAENSLNPEEKIIKSQKEKLLKEIVKKLPADYRRIVTMRYYNEYSYLEISEILEIPIGTVKARLHRSRELLLSTFEKHNIKKERL